MATPIANNDLYEVYEDEILRVNSPVSGVLGNDTDADNDALGAFVLTNPKNPLFDFKTNGTFIYDARYHGILYIDTDGDPTLSNFADAEVTLWNGFDALAEGAIVYDTFVYEANDGQDGDSAMVKIKITGVNDDPDAVNDSAMVQQDASDLDQESVIIDVLANDTDVDIWPMADQDNFMIVGLSDIADDGGPAGGTDNDADGGYEITTDEGGTVEVINGEIKYTALDGFFGIDTFEYTVSDPYGGTDTAVVRVTVLPDNDDPVANDDVRYVDEDDGETSLASVLGNDTDSDDAPLIAAELSTGIGSALTRVDEFGTPIAGATGTLVDFNSDGTFDYDPDGDFENLGVGDTAYVEFNYIAYDGHGASDTATVTIEIAGENDNPTGEDPDRVSVYEAGLVADGGDIPFDGSQDDPTDTEIPVQQDIDITINDVDDSDTPFVAGTTGGSLTTLNGTYGTLEFVDDDTVRYTLTSNADHSAVQGHNGGIYDDFTVYVVDEHDGYSEGVTVSVEIIDDINFLVQVPVNDDVTFDALNTLADTSVNYTKDAYISDTFTLYAGADGQMLELVGLPNNFTLKDGRVIELEYYTGPNGEDAVRGVYDFYDEVLDETVQKTFYTLTIDSDPDNDGDDTPEGSYTLTVLESPPTVSNPIDFSAIDAGGPVENPTVEDIGFNGFFFTGDDLADLVSAVSGGTLIDLGGGDGSDDINPNNAGGIGIGNGNIDELEVLQIDMTGSTGDITGVVLDLQGVGGGVPDDPDLIYVVVDEGVVIDSGYINTNDINVKGGETITIEPNLENGEEIDQIYLALDPEDVDSNDKVRINRIETLEKQLEDNYVLSFALASTDGDGDQSPYDGGTEDIDALEFEVTILGATNVEVDNGINLDDGYVLI
ncbi:Ig-like domain-containing protein [Marinomonas aquimarina]|nr:Ig-like domain-containing protein [Marinomonas aquimarina]